MPDALTLRMLTGSEIETVLGPLAFLRMRVFREWPYLYEGSDAYEARYLRGFAGTRDAACVVAEDGGEPVGCSTGCALTDHEDGVSEPLAAAGYDPGGVYYLAESVLLPDWRGRGLGHAFFDEREAHARGRGYERACFCAVERPADHPRRPDAYRPLDGFWRARGYRRLEGVTARMAWRDVGQARETEKSMAYWMRELHA